MSLTKALEPDNIAHLKDVILSFTPGPEENRQIAANLYHWAKRKVDFDLRFSHVAVACRELSDENKIYIYPYRFPVEPLTWVKRARDYSD